MPVQNSFTGRQIWRMVQSSPEIEKQYPLWQVNDLMLASSNPDTVIAISATHNIEVDVMRYISQCIKTVGCFVHYHLSPPGSTSVKDGTHAYLLAQNLVTNVRERCSGRNVSVKPAHMDTNAV